MYKWPEMVYIDNMKNKMFQVRIQDPMHGGLFFFETATADEAVAMAQDFVPTGEITDVKEVKTWDDLDGRFCVEEITTEPQDFRPTLAPMAAYD
jgi:hypothetical protein